MSLSTRGAAPQKTKIKSSGVVSGRKIRVTSTTGYARTDLPRLDDDYAWERDRALTKMTPDGLKPLTKQEQHDEHKMTKALLKKYTANILTCDYGAFSFPIAYSEPRSYLERTSELFAFLVNMYIPKAMETDDPVMKLVYITSGIVAGYHLDLNQKKVFNPMLGETYVGKWENGASIYAEQTSHHPPLSCFQLYGPDNSWYCYSDEIKFSVDNGLSQLDVAMKGVFHLQLKDGPLYEWEFPTVQLSGQVKGPRIVKIKGSIEVNDVTNNLVAGIEVNPKIKKRDCQSSTIFGGIKKVDKNKLKISLKEDYLKTFNGDYAQKVEINDNEVIWDIKRDIVHRAIGEVKDDELIPSDVRFRLDRNLLIEKNMEEADKAKTALEEVQRREEKIRVCVKKKTSNIKLK
ncbi:Oxysterol binding protein [Tritrichomonas foetus]|uniref:Oxysterol binding protein n=1 Tax=Tritrichomonas foetus TaxID=1144522 RepID=A0A1J4KZG3_9EUKA|nr:Oxysterol binding protein [Tritrichomonas foetus]|eukprot:OHT16256.1 Oxysterol binding protein [Tritrichomonas foetus]